MRVYGLAYRDTMSLPVTVFWHLSGTVPRLLAGEHKATLEMTTLATHDPSGAVERLQGMDQQFPEPVVLTAQAVIQVSSVRDEAGFNELRGMS